MQLMKTTKAKRQPVENDAYADMVARVLAALGRRAAMGDPEDLAKFREVIDGAEYDLRRAVIGLRAQGHTWAQIGEALGMARQSAWERFSGKNASGKPDGQGSTGSIEPTTT